MSCYAQASVAMTPTITGEQIAGMLAFPVVAAAGAAMWCGGQLHRVYEAQQEAARQKWAADDERRMAQSRRLLESQALATELALARWRTNNPSLNMPTAHEAALDHTVAQIAAEIEEELAKGDAALASLRQECDAYRTREASGAQGSAQYNRDCLAQARLWQERGSPIASAKLDQFERRLALAEEYLTTDSASAQKELQELRSSGEALRDEAKDTYFGAWDQLIRQASTLRDQVAALADVLTQAVATRVVANAREMASELAGLQAQLAQATTSPMDAPGALAQLATQLDGSRRDVERLADTIFGAISVGQQQSIASTIADTLRELGYVGDMRSGTAVTSETVGDERHVVGLRQEGDPQRRDEKRVAFFIQPDGTVAYDFSGYAGDACVRAAREVFDALRARGLVLLNEQAADELSRQEAGVVSTDPRAYAGEQYLPPMPVNSPQVARLNKLLEVLRAMGFGNQVIRQETASGTMIVDAFNGELGYHIVLPPHGEDDLPFGTRREHGHRTEIDTQSPDRVMQELGKVQEPPNKPRRKRNSSGNVWSSRQRQPVSSTSTIASEGR